MYITERIVWGLKIPIAKSVFGSFLATIFLMPVANATPILVSGSQRVEYALNVVVKNKNYRVDFIDGSPCDIWTACDPSLFAFNTNADAKSAAQALLDQVFVTWSNGDPIDSQPGRLRGIGNVDAGEIFTPYWFNSNGMYVVVTVNGVDEVNDIYFSEGPFSVGYDSTNSIEMVWAKWTFISVPEPSTFILMSIASVVFSLPLTRSRGARSRGQHT